MTLAHSSPPCSQMCRYSCPWTTPPCTSLSLLTWGCPCVAWRFSTNHWPLTSTTSCLLIPLPSPTALSTQPPLLLLPHCAPPLHFLWHHLCVAGWSTDSSFSFSAQTPSSLITAPVPTHPPSPSRLVRRQCIPLLFLFSFNLCLHLHVFFHVCVSCFVLYFYLVVWFDGLKKTIHCGAVLLCPSVTSLSLIPIHCSGPCCRLHSKTVIILQPIQGV